MSFQQTVDRYFHAIAIRDKNAWLETFSQEAGLTHHDPVGTPARHSHEEIGGFWDQIMGLFQEVKLTPQEIFPGGERISLTWEGRGRGHNGAEVVFRGIDVFTPDSQGKILKLEAYWDANPTLARLMAP